MTHASLYINNHLMLVRLSIALRANWQELYHPVAGFNSPQKHVEIISCRPICHINASIVPPFVLSRCQLFTILSVKRIKNVLENCLCDVCSQRAHDVEITSY